MARPPRVFVPGYPHHIVQLGYDHHAVFIEPADYEYYLANLIEWKSHYQVAVYAYCLMTNHIHLVAVPATDTGLQNVLKPLHMRYAQRFNRQKGWQGHVWQGRYFSSPLDESYL